MVYNDSVRDDMRRRIWAALLLMSGCFYPADRGRMLESRLEQVSASQEEMNAEMRRNEERVLVRVEEKVASMQKTLAGLDRTSRRSDADTGLLLQKNVEEVAVLRGQMEALAYRSSQLEAQLAKLEEDTRKKLAEINSAQTQGSESSKPKQDDLKRPDNKKDFLALADEKAQSGDTALARQLYTEFLKKWEKDPLAGEAHYGLGETWLKDSRWREAIFEFGKVIQEFPKSRSAPQAYLRSAACFRTLKMDEESRLALEELIRLYPKSESAKTAKVELAAMVKATKAKGKK